MKRYYLSLKKLKLLALVPVILALLLAVACGDDATPTAPATSTSPAPTATSPAPTATAVPAFLLKAPEANPKYGGKVTAVHTIGSLVHWDMQQSAATTPSWALHNTFDNLVRIDPFSPGLSVVVADLATSWQVSDDGLTYTFNLRSGVKWHDGTDFTAEDVKATFDRIANSPANVVLVNKGSFETVTEVRVINPMKVQFTLSQARGLFLKILGVPKNAVMQKAILEANNFDLKKVKGSPGTGPFMVLNAEAGEFVEFERNPNYWNPNLPYLDGILTRHFGWGPATGAAFLAGQGDLALGIDPETQKRTIADPNKVFNKFPGTSPQHIVLNNTRAPFNDVRVRKAVHLALDYDALRRSVADVTPFGPAGWVLAGDDFNSEYWPKVNGQPGWRKPTADDISAAKKLLTDAGYPSGIKDLVLRSRDEAGSKVAMTTAQGLLKQVLGIESTLLLDVTGVHYEQIGKGDFDLAETGAGQPMPLVHFLWSDLLGTGAARNWSNYSNTEFDALMQKILAERDDDKLNELIWQGVEILDRDVPILMYGHEWIPTAWKADLKGVSLKNANTTDLGGRFKLDTIWLDR